MKIKPAFFIAAGILLTLAFAGPAMAQHLKSAKLGTVLNPLNWEEELYDPGMVVSNAINHMGETDPRLIWVTIEAAKKNVDDETDDPLAMGFDEGESEKKKEEKKLPVQFILEAELVVFRPHVDIPESMIGMSLEEESFAEIQMHLKVVDYYTQRVVSQKHIWAVGAGGSKPFPNSPDSLIPGHPDFQDTSMGNAIENLGEKVFHYLAQVLNEIPLDSQVLFVDENLDQVTLNVGMKHGVRVGEEFTIYKLTRNVEDPITGADLGDLFRRLGVVRIMEVGEGFSEAMVQVGANFRQGMIARGEKQDVELMQFANSSAGAVNSETQPGLPFEGFKRDREYPRSTFTSFDFFSIMGFELGF